MSGESAGGIPEDSGASEPAARVREALSGVIDPELGLDVVSLGLIYDVEVYDGGARVVHTLTTPGCPLGDHISGRIREAAASVEGVQRAETELVWEPRWSPEMIDDDAWNETNGRRR